MNTKAITALVVLLLAGGGLAIALNGGDDSDDEAATTVPPVATAPATSTSSAPETTTETAKDGASEEEQVEQVVTEYLEQESQSETVSCDLVIDDVCVQNESDIDLSSFQGVLDQLEVQDVQVDGDRAKAELNRGGSFELQRDGERWKISGFEPPARPDGTGGVEAPDGTGGVEAPQRPEREKPVKPQKPDLPQR